MNVRKLQKHFDRLVFDVSVRLSGIVKGMRNVFGLNLTLDFKNENHIVAILKKQINNEIVRFLKQKIIAADAFSSVEKTVHGCLLIFLRCISIVSSFPCIQTTEDED